MTVTTIVLAAGRGVRLGGPKALLAWPLGPNHHVPLAAAHAAVRQGAESDRALIVTRADIATALAHHAPDLVADLVVSQAPDDLGPAGSIAAAVRFLATERPGQPISDGDPATLVLITPVDCPPAGEETVRVLVEALANQPDWVAARPKHGPRRGHPVVLRLPILAAYEAANPPPLRDLLGKLGAAVVDVELDDEVVLMDIDNPEDLATWAARRGSEISATPRFFWP